MGEEKPGHSAAGDTSLGHFPCLTHERPQDELLAHSSQHSSPAGSNTGGKGLAQGQAASPRQAVPLVPNPGAHRIPLHRNGVGPDGITTRLPPELPGATAYNKLQSRQGSSQVALREVPQAGQALDLGRG